MQQHLLEQDLARVLHTKGYHGQAVANEDDVHACMVGHVGAREVMGSDDGDGLPLLMQGPQGSDGDLFAGVAGRSAQGGM
jgi:hypothetical protein